MADAYIVDAVRTAGGKRGGKLAGFHPVDLGAAVLDAIADRNDFDPAAIEDVIMGCVSRAASRRASRPQCRACARSCPIRPGCHHRPAMRIVAASHAVRGARRDVGHAGYGDRGRR